MSDQEDIPFEEEEKRIARTPGVQIDIKTTIRNEQRILRNELQALKKCQLQYFLLSVAATGAVFGFNNTILASTNFSSMIFLAPLLVIVPCWWTFFDKATTITRLTGYTRMLEEQLSNTTPFYIGYENALALFREEEEKETYENRSPGEFPTEKRSYELKKLLRLLTLRTRHRYWMINWYTFLLLSLTCCIVPFFLTKIYSKIDWYTIVFFICATFVLISGYQTFRIVNNLTTGKYSYKKVTEFWKTRVFKNT
ncbi:MAG: hypothetical protein ACUZ8I_06160 [Candidatus Scalindua sp.]